MNTEDFDFEEVNETVPEAAEEISENRRAYEDVTEERLREVIEDIAEEHPERVRRAIEVDVANIPIGMTTEQYVEYSQTTGTTITNTTDTVYINMDTDATSSITSVDFETEILEARDRLISEGSVTVVPNEDEKEPVAEPQETTKQTRVRLRKELSPVHYKELAKINLQAKRTNQIANLKFKRSSNLRTQSFTSNDLIILGNDTMYHHDMTGEIAINRGDNRMDFRFKRGFHLDKHMNFLTSDYPSKNQSKSRPRIYDDQTAGNLHGNRDRPDTYKYMILDKTAFMESGGTFWKIKRREGIDIKNVAMIKRDTIKRLTTMKRASEMMCNVVEPILGEDNMDIIWELDGHRASNISYFSLLLKFKDITISNSIEMEHHIGDMIIKRIGVLAVHSRNTVPRINLNGSVYGTRMTFVPVDAVKGYHHSHCPSFPSRISSFCTGSESYRCPETGDYMNDMDLEAHIHKLSQFLHWESLEGGPHVKMESINIFGRTYKIHNGISKPIRVSDRYMTHILKEIERKGGYVVFKNCFVLINTGGELRFDVDFERFYRTFIGMFTNDEMIAIRDKFDSPVFIYQTDNNCFYMNNNSDSRSGTEVIRKALIQIKKIKPIYMNGKYHRPTLDTSASSDPFEGKKLVPDPDFMKDVARIILYHLTVKLDEYGNTSEKTKESRIPYT